MFAIVIHDEQQMQEIAELESEPACVVGDGRMLCIHRFHLADVLPICLCVLLLAKHKRRAVGVQAFAVAEPKVAYRRVGNRFAASSTTRP